MYNLSVVGAQLTRRVCGVTYDGRWLAVRVAVLEGKR